MSSEIGKAINESRAHPAIEKAISDVDQIVKNFLENPAQKSAILGEVYNSTLGAGDHVYAYAAKPGGRRNPLPPHIVGEIFLSKVRKFETDFISKSEVDEKGKLKADISTFRVRGQDWAFVRREEFEDGRWANIFFNIERPDLKLN